MRNLPMAIGGLVVILLLMAFTSVQRSFNKVEIIKLEAKPIEVILPNPLEGIKVEIDYKGHNDFLQAIGHRESGNRYEVVNSFGYMGKYQFGKSTLKGLGFDVTVDEFINSPYIQEKAMNSLLLHNQKKLRKFIEQYEGQVVHGVLITESGVLAAAHLAGAGNVKKFFKKGFEFEDGYGTKMTSYMAQFSGYTLRLNGGK